MNKALCKYQLLLNIGVIISFAGCGGPPISGDDSAPAESRKDEQGRIFAPRSLEASTSVAEHGSAPATSPAQRIATQVNRIAPDVEGALRTSVIQTEDVFRAVGNRLDIQIPTRNHGWVTLRHPSEARPRIRVALPVATHESAAVVASDGTVTYQNGIEGLDVAVQAFDHGVRIQTILNHHGAPAAVTYLVDVPTGGKIMQGKDGGLLIVDASGLPKGGFGAPWAKDNQNRDVATRYEVHGDAVEQIVEHSAADVEYPVVADPWLWSDLIDSATWDSADPHGWTLKVSPTSWARSFCLDPLLSYSVGSAGWDELYEKYKTRGLNTNLNGMRDQFICHQQFAYDKATWNLDEWRPDVGYVQTVNYRCNPGGSSIFD